MKTFYTQVIIVTQAKIEGDSFIINENNNCKVFARDLTGSFIELTIAPIPTSAEFS